MSLLFEPIALGGLTLRNRVVIPPMCQHSCQDGLASDWHLIHLGSMALSGVGLMILESTAVSPEARIGLNCLGLWSDEHEAALGDVIRRVRAFSDVKIGVQLSHAGRKASSRSPKEGRRGPLPLEEGGWVTVSASAMEHTEGGHVPVAIDRAGMDAVVADFVSAAQRADRIGFDVVELHGAHGYLLSSFLSPLANARDDEYGGSLENRMRFPLEVFAAVREVWPEAKALGVRINGTDWAEGGITPDEAAEFAARLEALGCDFIDVSSGGNRFVEIPVGPSYQVPLAETVKQRVDVPVIAVGLITGAEQAEELLASGKSDLVAVGRGHLHNPHWTWEAAEDLGATVDVPYQYERAATRSFKPVVSWKTQ